jgi:hypothetical protein
MKYQYVNCAKKAPYIVAGHRVYTTQTSASAVHTIILYCTFLRRPDHTLTTTQRLLTAAPSSFMSINQSFAPSDSLDRENSKEHKHLDRKTPIQSTKLGLEDLNRYVQQNGVDRVKDGEGKFLDEIGRSNEPVTRTPTELGRHGTDSEYHVSFCEGGRQIPNQAVYKG